MSSIQTWIKVSWCILRIFGFITTNVMFEIYPVVCRSCLEQWSLNVICHIFQFGYDTKHANVTSPWSAETFKHFKMSFFVFSRSPCAPGEPWPPCVGGSYCDSALQSRDELLRPQVWFLQRWPRRQHQLHRRDDHSQCFKIWRRTLQVQHPWRWRVPQQLAGCRRWDKRSCSHWWCSFNTMFTRVCVFSQLLVHLHLRLKLPVRIPDWFVTWWWELLTCCPPSYWDSYTETGREVGTLTLRVYSSD